MKGQIINLATAVQTYARLLVVYDKQPNGALPTYATVMQTRDNAGAATNTAFSDLTLTTKKGSLSKGYNVRTSQCDKHCRSTNQCNLTKVLKMTSTYSMLTCT